MKQPLKVLIAEDNTSDAELVIAELNRAGFDPSWTRVETEAEFLAEIIKLPDIVLSDFSMPQFTGLHALELLKHSGLDIPFILISGTIGEEVAVDAMKCGATDYLLKDRIARLGSAVTQALEQKRLREERRQIGQQLTLQAAALETAANGVLITDTNARILWVNPAFCSAAGYSPSELIGRTPRLLKSGRHSPGFYSGFWKTILSGRTWRGEFINRRKDGSLYYDEHTVTPVYSKNGDIAYFVAITSDVTDRKRLEEAALHEQKQKILHQSALLALATHERTNYDNALKAILTTDSQTLGVKRVSFWRLEQNPKRLICEALYLAHENRWERSVDLVAERFPRYFAALETNPLIAASDAMNDARTCEFAQTYLQAHGITSMLDVPVWLRGTLAGVVCHEHVGERRAWTAAEQDFALSIGQMLSLAINERELASRDQRLDSFFTSAAAGMCIMDKQLRFLRINETLARINGLPIEAHIGKTLHEVVPALAPVIAPVMRSVLETGRPVLNREISGHTPADAGALRHWSVSYFPVAGDAGETAEIGAVIVEITQRIQAEKALRESDQKFRQLAENINEVFWITDPSKKEMLYISPAYERIWGRSCRSLYLSPESWLDAIYPDDFQRVVTAMATRQAMGTYDETYRIVRPDRSVRWIRDCAFPVRNDAGEVERIVGVATDITEERILEERLRQGQKMEAIGQLAGGVAHDFNNILAIIQMQAGLLQGSVELPPDLRDHASEIGRAAQRAANLTRQLLLFSRRQTLQPRDLDLNEIVTNIVKMLQRILGEDIQMQFKLSSHPLYVHADAGMLDQVLMNLTVNSRDAMPNGGSLIIETAAIHFDELDASQVTQARPGDFVCLSVSDTGCGIPKDSLPRIFEPFYTTKEVGKGTGLGLATVFGIVQQHRGWVNVYSELGHGSTFRVYFPRLMNVAAGEDPAQESPPVAGGTETILLVEDEMSLRSLVKMVLTRMGYTVLQASTGISALELWKNHEGAIDLLIADLVLPDGMSGRKLAERLLLEKPDLNVIYVSGYSAEIAGKDFPLDEGVNFLAKPFEAHRLAKIVRECLDRRRLNRLGSNG